MIGRRPVEADWLGSIERVPFLLIKRGVDPEKRPLRLTRPYRMMRSFKTFDGITASSSMRVKRSSEFLILDPASSSMRPRHDRC